MDEAAVQDLGFVQSRPGNNSNHNEGLGTTPRFLSQRVKTVKGLDDSCRNLLYSMQNRNLLLLGSYRNDPADRQSSTTDEAAATPVHSPHPRLKKNIHKPIILYLQY